MSAAEKLRALAKAAPTHFTDEDGCPRELHPDARRLYLDCRVVEEIAALLELAEGAVVLVAATDRDVAQESRDWLDGYAELADKLSAVTP